MLRLPYHLILLGLVCIVALTNITLAAESESGANANLPGASSEKSDNSFLIYLDDYEPNLIGLTQDSDDEQTFLDFKVSLKYPIARRPLERWNTSESAPGWYSALCKNYQVSSCQPYFAFTGRFGQYIGTRESSPVISKRFNPKWFLRLDSRQYSGSYLDIEYAHESNGQRIDTQESYQRLFDEFSADGANGKNERGENANDYISRGWDYWGLTAKYQQSLDNEVFRSASYYVSYKEFIGGLLQGDIEEYFTWEDNVFEARKITRREQVDGLRFIAKLQGHNVAEASIPQEDYFNGYKLAFIYETGNHQAFKHSTYQLEFTTRFLTMPIMFWYRNGYNSDLAQYYRKVESVGITFEFRTFE